MSNTSKPAPPFDPTKTRSDYPLSGGQTGPAWRAAWDVLQAHADYLPAKDIVERVHEMTNVNPRTIRNLLIAAEKAEILEAVVRLHEGRNWTHYRIRKAHR